MFFWRDRSAAAHKDAFWSPAGTRASHCSPVLRPSAEGQDLARHACARLEFLLVFSGHSQRVLCVFLPTGLVFFKEMLAGKFSSLMGFANGWLVAAAGRHREGEAQLAAATPQALQVADPSAR